MRLGAVDDAAAGCSLPTFPLKTKKSLVARSKRQRARTKPPSQRTSNLSRHARKYETPLVHPRTESPSLSAVERGLAVELRRETRRAPKGTYY